MSRRRTMLMNGQEDDEMKEWKLLSKIQLEEAKNVAFELKNIDCNEIYIFANVGITQTGNTSIEIGDQGFFTGIFTVGQLKYSTIHCFVVGGMLLADEVADYALKGYMQNKTAIHPNKMIRGTTITDVKLVRNAPTNTFLSGSTFEIYGR